MTKAAARAKMDEAVKAARAAESRAWRVWCGAVVAAAKANAEIEKAWAKTVKAAKATDAALAIRAKARAAETAKTRSAR